jgi:tetratricopeptide (TPR) repeat protein
VGESVNNLAVVFTAQAKYKEAEGLYKRALAIREQALGPNHADVGQTLNNLALVYLAQAKYTEAAGLFERALAIPPAQGNRGKRKGVNGCFRHQPERKEKHRNGQRRANHEQRHELSKLSATHDVQHRPRQTRQTEGDGSEH